LNAIGDVLSGVASLNNDEDGDDEDEYEDDRQGKLSQDDVPG